MDLKLAAHFVSKFSASEAPVVEAMIKKMKVVSSDDFTECIAALLLRRLKAGSKPVGIYVEREVPHRKGRPHRLFREEGGKSRRAVGGGPQPVRPVKPYDLKVGSEGIVAQIVSEFCKQHPTSAFSHPGPNKIRKSKIRRFILVTDFIGSGRRASQYLYAAWRVKSVRSWWSARRKKGVSFEVLAYSATMPGKAFVESHPCTPAVHLVTTCPTVEAITPADLSARAVEVCLTRDPVRRDPVESLGFGGNGTLIAFAHGMPNNCPRIFHVKTVAWEPLFPSRITRPYQRRFNDARVTDWVAMRVDGINQLQTGDTVAAARRNTVRAYLAALTRPPRVDEAISLRTGLTFDEVEALTKMAMYYKWIDSTRHLTDLGRGELKRLGPAILNPPPLLKEDDFYYPSSLRAPH